MDNFLFNTVDGCVEAAMAQTLAFGRIYGSVHLEGRLRFLLEMVGHAGRDISHLRVDEMQALWDETWWEFGVLLRSGHLRALADMVAPGGGDTANRHLSAMERTKTQLHLIRAFGRDADTNYLWTQLLPRLPHARRCAEGGILF